MKVGAEMGDIDVSNMVLPANASWMDHAILYIIKDPKSFFGWVAAVFFPLLMCSACASFSLMRDIERQERRAKRSERKQRKTMVRGAKKDR